MLPRAALESCLCPLVALVGWAACSSGSDSRGNADARPAAFRDSDIYDTADAPAPVEEDAAVVLPECPATCDDKNPCTVDSCDPDTHVCRNVPGNEGGACVSSDLCALEATCKAGLCIGDRNKDCSQAPDLCHQSGYCVTSTGACSYPEVLDTTPCDDGDLCTTADQCTAGVCKGSEIQCGPGLTCDPKTGQCPGFPTASWAFALDPNAGMTLAAGPEYSDLAISAKGALYFAGGFANTLDLGAGAMSTTSNAGQSLSAWDYDAVVAKLDPTTGRAIWSKSFGDRAMQTGGALAANRNDIVLVTGLFNGHIDVTGVDASDGGTLSLANSTAFPKAFMIAVAGTSGKVLWARATDIAGNDVKSVLKVAADPSDGNFVLCGSPSVAATGLGVATVAGGNKADVLVAKLNAETGEVMWKGQYGSAADETCTAVTVDEAGKVYLAGYLARGGALDLGNGISLSGPSGASQKKMYVAQLDGLTGKAQWGKSFAGQGGTNWTIWPKTIATDHGTVWVGGSFSASAVFGGTTLSPPSLDMDAGVVSSGINPSAFVAAFAAGSGALAWAKNWGLMAEVTGVSPTAAKTLIIVGSYSTAMEFDTGTLSDVPNGAAAVPFVAKLDGASGAAQAARGYASASGTTPSAFAAVVVGKAGAASPLGAPYVVGRMGQYRTGIDLGPPVGWVRFDAGDAGTHSDPTLLLGRFEP